MVKLTKRGQRGAVLLIVLIMVLTISLLGATLMALFFNVLTFSQIELDRTRALYLAEAGIAKALGVLKNQAGVGAAPESPAKADEATGTKRSDRIIAPTQLDGGYYEVFNDFLQSTIISIGTSNGVRRTIQVKYNAF